VISAILCGVLAAVVVIATFAIAIIYRKWAVDPHRLSANMRDAEPRIRHILEHATDPGMCWVDMHRITSLNLLGVDHSAATIKMAMVTLELGRRAGMDTDEVLDMFGPGLPESIEDEL
jgi:hypothetical protein